jgi:hypothetical protein
MWHHGQMVKSAPSVDLALKYGLPGRLGIDRHGVSVQVELDLPRHEDRVKENFLPGVEALVLQPDFVILAGEGCQETGAATR